MLLKITPKDRLCIKINCEADPKKELKEKIVWSIPQLTEFQI